MASTYRFALAALLPLAVGVGAWRSPWAAWFALLAIQVILTALELLPTAKLSPPSEPMAVRHRAVLWVHVPLQSTLLIVGVLVATRHPGDWLALLALGVGVGGVTGGQGITMAHELGHSRSKIDRLLAWVLMSSVLYAHFMVEHYRGHHARAATCDDPASARLGESLWCFLPRTLSSSLSSAWRLESLRLAARRKRWVHSPLLWATVAQASLLMALLAVGGGAALVFWCAQAAYAVFLLETTNYIEHYGLRREGGEPFQLQHAWNADHMVTNCFIVNLPRHSDHHMNAWKPYAELDALPGPQLPTGYVGCLFLAMVPPLWRRVMDGRARSWAGATT